VVCKFRLAPFAINHLLFQLLIILLFFKLQHLVHNLGSLLPSNLIRFETIRALINKISQLVIFKVILIICVFMF